MASPAATEAAPVFQSNGPADLEGFDGAHHLAGRHEPPVTPAVAPPLPIPSIDADFLPDSLRALSHCREPFFCIAACRAIYSGWVRLQFIMAVCCVSAKSLLGK